MLALLYGLLGEFSVGLLVLRIEETAIGAAMTAIGAAIGILVAVFVLPTSTRAEVADGIEGFLGGLGELVGHIGQRLSRGGIDRGPH